MDFIFTLRDFFVKIFAACYEKTISLSKYLKDHLHESAKNGSPLAILFAQIALFTATIFVQKTKLYAEHDSTGFITALSYAIMAILLSNSWRLCRHRFIPRPCNYTVNSIFNLICSILAIFLEKHFEKSWSSLAFFLSIKVLLLILLVIIKPSIDFGLFGFLIGVILSVSYNLFRVKFQFLIVVAICFPPSVFRCWLECNWLGKDLAQTSETTDSSTDGREQICKSETIEELTVGGFHLFWVYNLFRTNCRNCTSSSIIMGMPACLLVFNLWFGVALIPRVCSLFKTDPEADPEAGAGVGSQNYGSGAGTQNFGPRAGSQYYGAGTQNFGPRAGSQYYGPGAGSQYGPGAGSQYHGPGARSQNNGPGAGSQYHGPGARNYGGNVNIGTGAGGSNSGSFSGTSNSLKDSSAGGLRRRTQVDKEGATKISSGTIEASGGTFDFHDGEEK